MARRKVTVQEAADRLDAGVDAVRQRIKRGKLERAEADDPEDPRVYVWLDLDQSESRHKVEVEDDPASGNGVALVESLQAQVGHLLRELEIRNEELRRKDHLLAAAIERIPRRSSRPRGSRTAPPVPPKPRRTRSPGQPREGRTRTRRRPGGAGCSADWRQEHHGGDSRPR